MVCVADGCGITGGILTLTVAAILENLSDLKGFLSHIRGNAIWLAYISPVVVGRIYRRAISEPQNERYVSKPLLLHGLLVTPF